MIHRMGNEFRNALGAAAIAPQATQPCKTSWVREIEERDRVRQFLRPIIKYRIEGTHFEEGIADERIGICLDAQLDWVILIVADHREASFSDRAADTCVRG